MRRSLTATGSSFVLRVSSSRSAGLAAAKADGPWWSLGQGWRKRAEAGPAADLEAGQLEGLAGVDGGVGVGQGELGIATLRRDPAALGALALAALGGPAQHAAA